MLGNGYESYTNTLKILSLEKLIIRYENLCLDFAIKCTKHTRHSDLFMKNPRYNLRTNKKFKEPKCLTTRYYNSAVPFLTRLLNNSTKL